MSGFTIEKIGLSPRKYLSFKEGKVLDYYIKRSKDRNLKNYQKLKITLEANNPFDSQALMVSVEFLKGKYKNKSYKIGYVSKNGYDSETNEWGDLDVDIFKVKTLESLDLGRYRYMEDSQYQGYLKLV